ncbi:exported carboxyl-terminal protease protein (plasmid) [Sinorhizobium americanum CCGM7]|uniref:S41 family peptidase n=1 Tax=Sinorhizobium americanum TaxID=194963 RepID=UPI0004D6BA64|nr:S41 family peptidase [Sinorhizobium americanum]APG88390.1 exported carboxyl-terminal protease protein [Sinorhizobium americanum CCGM7]
MKTCRSLLFAFLLLLVPGHGFALDLPRSGHPVFDRAVELVVDNFYDTSGLARFRAAVRQQLTDERGKLTAKSAEDRVDAAVESVLASLGVSHTGRFTADTIDYYELADIFRFAIRNDIKRLFPPDGDVHYAGIGMVTRLEGAQRFVSDVYDGAPAARAGIRLGDEILSVDGLPYREIASFRDRIGRTVDVRLRRHRNALPITLTVAVERLQPLRTFEKAIETSIAVTEREGRRIGYLRLWTLSTRDGLDIVASELAGGRLKDADGVIVDLRGRWGGGPPDAAGLFVGGVPTFRLISRDGKDMFGTVRWRRPVVAIIDEGSRSGLELFAHALKVNGIPLVGSRTAGALLAGRAFLLPDDSLLEVAVSDAVIDEGLRLEGHGVEPDIAVPFSLPYAAGRDPQLDAAMMEMQRILAKG